MTDVPAAVEFYTKRLGFTLGFTWPESGPPTMAGVNLGDVQIFLEQRRAESRRHLGVLRRRKRRRALRGAAGERRRDRGANRPTGRTGSATISHAIWTATDWLRHYIYNTGEPIEIERVDVPVRLEKRLAALLHDLAAYKR